MVLLARSRAKFLLLVFVWCFVSVCQGIGFGELKVYSYLSEPLYAEIELTGFEGMDPNLLKASIASDKVFANAGIDRPYFLSFLAFQIVTYEDRLFIVVRSNKVVQSPYLEFLVELSWPDGNIVKEYTLLLDPPPADLTNETRPKGYGQLNSEAAAAAKPFGENKIQSQLNMQIAQQQKEAAESSLVGVVREGNKFSDQTLEVVPKAPPPTAAQIQQQQQTAEDYGTQRKDFIMEQQQQAINAAKKLQGSLLQNVVSDVSDFKSDIEPTINIGALANASSEPIDFNQVIKPVSPTNQTLAKHGKNVATAAAANLPIPAPPTKGNHLYLGIILSLLLIAAGVGIAIKRGLLKSIFVKPQPAQPKPADKTEEVPFTENTEDQQFAKELEEFTAAEELDEHIEMSSTPIDTTTTAAVTATTTSPPAAEDLDKIEKEFANINFDTLATPPAEATPTAAEILQTITRSAPAPTPEPEPISVPETPTVSEPAPAPEPEPISVPETPTVPEPAPAPEPEPISVPETPTVPEPTPTTEPKPPAIPPAPEPEVPTPAPEPEPIPEPAPVPEVPVMAEEIPEPKPSTSNLTLAPDDALLISATEPQAPLAAVTPSAEPEIEAEEAIELIPVPVPETTPTIQTLIPDSVTPSTAETFAGPTLYKENEDSKLSLGAEGATLVKEDEDGILDNSAAMQVKIDLAKQYIATGDQDSAKDLLREIIEVANDAQRLEAQILLNTLV